MLRIGIVGTGLIAEKMITAGTSLSDVTFTAVSSRSAETGADFARRFSLSQSYTSVEEMAADSGIDAIYIASPNCYHARQALTAMRAGKHVLCEKPLTTTAEDAHLLFDTARENGVICLEAMRTIFNPGFAVVQNNLYRLGTLRRVLAVYCKYSSRYDSFKRGEEPNAFTPRLGNAALMDLGVYCVEPTIAILGRKPKQVATSHVFLAGDFEGQGTISANFEGVQGDWMYSKIANSHVRSEIQGEEGTLLIDHWDRMEGLTLILRDGTREDMSVPTAEIDLCYELAAFAEMVKDGTGQENYNQWSMQTVETLERICNYSGIRFKRFSFLRENSEGILR